MRRRGGLLIGVLAGVLALAAAGCGGGDDGDGSASATTAVQTTTPETTAAGGGGDDELKLTASGTAWDTTSFDLTSGTNYSLEVTNQDTFQHNFTFEAVEADENIEGGEDATLTFTAPAAGSYEFFCAIHPSAMRGTFTVT